MLLILLVVTFQPIQNFTSVYLYIAKSHTESKRLFVTIGKIGHIPAGTGTATGSPILLPKMWPKTTSRPTLPILGFFKSPGPFEENNSLWYQLAVKQHGSSLLISHDQFAFPWICAKFSAEKLYKQEQKLRSAACNLPL